MFEIDELKGTDAAMGEIIANLRIDVRDLVTQNEALSRELAEGARDMIEKLECIDHLREKIRLLREFQ